MGLALLSLWALAAQSFASASAGGEANVQTISRDVAIIGGGSAGTYTAIQLQRLGKTVALIETLGQLGGNVNTFVDPTNNETLDVGVIGYDNIPVVLDYLQYLNVSITKSEGGDFTTQYANFLTGSPVKIQQTSAAKIAAALRAYQTQLNKYPYLINGYNLPPTIPSDFFLSWGDFIKKYGLQDMAYLVNSYNQGVGNILNQSTLSMFKYLNAAELDLLNTGVSVATAEGNNQHIYDKALAKLGSAALVSSNVTSVRRSAHGVQLAVTTPNGKKVIQARQLVIAVRPILGALKPFLDLRGDETALFSRWNNTFYWCGLVANTGLPKNFSASNVDPSLPYNIPESPSLYDIGATSLTNNLQTVYYSSPYAQTDQVVQANVLAAVDRVRKGFGYPAPAGKPRIAYWRAHRPFFLGVSNENVKDGFYSHIEALQGKYRTHWTGAAWQSEDSSAIWNYTRAVTVPQILKSLKS